MPKRIRSSPAQLMGRLWKAKKARMRQMPPMTPGRITPGVRQLEEDAEHAHHHQDVGDVGIGDQGEEAVAEAAPRSALTGASLVASVTGPFVVFTVRPSIFASRSGTLSATRSTTLSFTASRSVTDTDERTAFSAHSTLRPRSVAIERAKAAASFSTFLHHLLVDRPPPTATGMRGADVGGGRHGGHVRGHRDEDAGGGRARAGRAPRRRSRGSRRSGCSARWSASSARGRPAC